MNTKVLLALFIGITVLFGGIVAVWNPWDPQQNSIYNNQEDDANKDNDLPCQKSPPAPCPT